MEKSKLKCPLFYGNFFNRDGRKIRAVFVREVSDGTNTYQLWHRAGKPKLKYNCAENDKYILYVEINGYLASLRETDYSLTRRCGFRSAEKELYGGSEERESFFNDLRKTEEGSEQIPAVLEKEEAVIKRHGEDPARQADFICGFLDEHIKTYLEAKENGGKTFPDFVGALAMDELAHCSELSVVYRRVQEEKKRAGAAAAEDADRAFCEERNREAEKIVSLAVSILKNNGVLKNEKVTFYRSRYAFNTSSIFNYLMRAYKVNAPLRTQGWINDKLLSVTIKKGRCVNVWFLRSHGGRCSQKFVDCMNELIRAALA